MPVSTRNVLLGKSILVFSKASELQLDNIVKDIFIISTEEIDKKHHLVVKKC